MSIKMICSDLDGTLLQYGRKTLEPEVFSLIEALADRGILFCPASGRQYTSLRALFAPVAERCAFLCENGGVLYKGETCIGKTPMPRDLAETIARDLWDRSEGQGEVMLSGQNCAYLMERGLGMLDRVKFIGNRYKIIRDPSDVPEEIVKVSVYLHEGVDGYVEGLCPAGKRPTAPWQGRTGSIRRWPTRAPVCRRSAVCWALRPMRSWRSGTTTTTPLCWTWSGCPISWTALPPRCGRGIPTIPPARKMSCRLCWTER